MTMKMVGINHIDLLLALNFAIAGRFFSRATVDICGKGNDCGQ